jgi:hypothetical protein
MSHGHAHEEAEHAQHATHDPFDKRVALTMVIIAAALAAVKVMGHRTHNDTLGYQIQAGVHHTRESDQWNFFQAKKMRQHLYESQSELLQSVLPEERRTDPETSKKIAAWAKQAKRYKSDSEKIKKDAEAEKEIAEDYQKKSEHKHHQSVYFDLGELGIELALVLSSVAILSKRSGFWFAGIGIGVVGLVAVGMGFFVH